MDPCDRFGLPLTTSVGEAAEHYSAGLDQLVSEGHGAEAAFVRAIRLDPRFAAPYAGLTVLRWQQGRKDLAQASAHRALRLVSGASRREQQLVDIVLSIAEGAGSIDENGHQAPNSVALERAYAHLAVYPRDALVLFIVNFLLVFSGHREHQRRLVRLFEELEPLYPNDWWFPSWHGFSLQEIGNFEGARPIIERALAMNGRNAVAAHGWAHILYEAGEDDHATAFLARWLPDYDPGASYHSHISWHYAILELGHGDIDKALSTYSLAIDPAVRVPVRTTLADAVGLLWRCVLRGADRRDIPWEGARVHALHTGGRAGVPFRDLLRAVAFIGSGDEASIETLVRELQEIDEGGHGVSGTVVLPVVQSMRAFDQGDYELCIARLGPALNTIRRIGGSRQQRELFEETLIEAYLRSGKAVEAKQMAVTGRSRAANRNLLQRLQSDEDTQPEE